MRILIICLLLSSCAQYAPKSYIKTIRYRELGIQCAQSYYFSYEYGKCVYLPPTTHYVNASDTPSGVSVDTAHSYRPGQDKLIKTSPDAQKRPNKRVLPKRQAQGRVDCQKVFIEANKCMEGN